jgi:hypothetical protein
MSAVNVRISTEQEEALDRLAGLLTTPGSQPATRAEAVRWCIHYATQHAPELKPKAAKKGGRP